MLGLLAGPLHGKGLVLPKSEPAKETSKEHPYLLIGDIVPNSLTLTDGEGKTRSLLSYKSSLEVMVLEFLSPRCPINVLAWRDLKRLYEAYKEWRVVFVGISVQPEESAGELAEAMAKAGLPYPALRDQNQSVARALHVLATPEIVIIDEWGHLRYRGALHDPPDVGRGLASSVAGAIQTPGKRPNIQYARDALDTVIGHVEAVPNAEPGGFIGCRIRGNTGNVRE